jgi:hypothetical protein
MTGSSTAAPDKPQWNFYPTVSVDGRYIVLHISLGTMNKNLFFVRNLEG